MTDQLHKLYMECRVHTSNQYGARAVRLLDLQKCPCRFHRDPTCIVVSQWLPPDLVLL